MKSPVALVLAAFLALVARPVPADLNVEKEIILSPERGRVAANIGSVDSSAAVAMVEAVVDIRIGDRPGHREEPIDIRVHAVFAMENVSADTVMLTVGFPISDSSYSAFEFDFFRVATDGAPRSVFQRVGHYPPRIEHRHVSGPDALAYTRLPDVAGRVEAGSGGSPPEVRAQTMLGTSPIGGEHFGNLMVWAETFAPHQRKSIDVSYAIRVPPRVSRWQRITVNTNIKGPHPDEANNLPAAFIDNLPEVDYYYFFDCYLSTGATWHGPIGRETITLHLDDAWRGHKLFFSRDVAAGRVEESKAAGDGGGLRHRWTIEQAEPAANLYFALRRP